MVPPAVVIRLELEAAPVVVVDVLDEHEERRLTHWLAVAHPEYGELAARALELCTSSNKRAA